MGGKKGVSLNSWMKKFCTLVFLQSIQAFIYAMIIVLIVSMSFEGIDDVNDRNASMGIISIIALTSVFKIEEMVKKIFGIGGTKADARGAMSSLAKTAIAWQFGKRVLDNGSKMIGGAKGIKDAAKGREKLKKRMDRDMATFGNGGGGSPSLGAGQDSSDSGVSPTSPSLPNASTSTGSSIPSGGTPSRGGKDTRDYNAMMDKYQDQLDELKKKRKESIRQIFQGVGETAGAVPGALAGAIIGGADGNLDEALRGAAVGMGMGDTIGGKVATTAYDLGGVPGNVKGAVDSAAKIREAVRQQQIDGRGLEKARNVARAYYREATKNRVSETEIQEMINRANEANADNAN